MPRAQSVLSRSRRTREASSVIGVIFGHMQLVLELVGRNMIDSLTSVQSGFVRPVQDLNFLLPTTAFPMTLK